MLAIKYYKITEREEQKDTIPGINYTSTVLCRFCMECDNRKTTDNTEQGTETSTRQIERPTDKTLLFYYPFYITKYMFFELAFEVELVI